MEGDFEYSVRVDRLGLDASAKCVSADCESKEEGKNGNRSWKSGKIDSCVCDTMLSSLSLSLSHTHKHTHIILITKPENSYVEKADFVVIVAPGCLHADRRDPNTNLRNKICYRTYRNRGWCVLEVFASFLSRYKTHPSLLITSQNGTPEWISPQDLLNLAVGTSDFTCCQRNHVFGNKVVPCDRGITRKIMEGMIEAKVDFFFKRGDTLRARMCQCLSNWWLRTESIPEENHSDSLHSFKMFLRCEEKHAKMWTDHNGVPILLYAIIRNDIEVVRALTASPKCTKSRINAKFFKNGLPEFAILGKISFLHAAVVFASLEIVRFSFFFFRLRFGFSFKKKSFKAFSNDNLLTLHFRSGEDSNRGV
jgi:hypothetical protein